MTQATASKPSAGVLPIPAAITEKSSITPITTAAKSAAKASTSRLKLIIRRLPPGLTQSEFETFLGDEWMTGLGKIDWLLYRPGKVSRDPAKQSRSSRAYVHVTSEDLITPLSDKVRSSSFQDLRNTSADPVLLGPPSLEFAPYARTSNGRVRKDGRQGTIDQDPEFIAFLESLTNPIPPKSTSASTTAGDLGGAGAGDTDQKDVRVGEEKPQQNFTITPLVQFIKDKKANKGKEAAAAIAAAGGKSGRHGKGGGEKEKKAAVVQTKKLLKRSMAEKEPTQPSASSDKKAKPNEKVGKEAVKVVKQQSASGISKSSKQALSSSTSTGSPTSTTTPKDGATAPTASGTSSTPASQRKRERGDISAAARILQRDLGLTPASSRRRGGKSAEAEAKSEKSQDTLPTPSKVPKQTPSTKPSKDNRTTKSSDPKGGPTQSIEQPPARNATSATNPSGTSASAGKPSGTQKPSKANTPSPTATQAFLKHANPSQGVTEPLLEVAFSPFGKLLKVEIDKKKGYGYLDFEEPEGLQKAIAASPVPVGQGQVVVLERKITPSSQPAKKKGDQHQAKANTPQQQTKQGATAQPQQEKETLQQGGKGSGEGGRGRSGRGGRGRNRVKEGTKSGGDSQEQGSKEPTLGEKAALERKA